MASEESREQPRNPQTSRRVRRLVEDDEWTIVQEAIDFIREKWGEDRPCPYCQSDRWAVGTAVTASELRGTDKLVLIPVMCTNCGHTVFLNPLGVEMLGEDEP